MGVQRDLVHHVAELSPRALHEIGARQKLKRATPISFIFCLMFLGKIYLVGAIEGISYENYSKVLETYVNEKGNVNYRELKENSSELEAFLNNLETLDPKNYQEWNKEEKIAFWINSYNAFTLKVIIDHYPIKSSFFRSLSYPKNSIRQIPGAWDKITFSVMGKELTLDQIEHQILRREFQEPRIHMALVCAANSCPLLRREPYEGFKLHEQLKDQTEKFLAEPRNFSIDKINRRIYLSSVFKWFGEDFIKTYGVKTRIKGHNPEERAVLHFISQHLPEEERKFLYEGFYSIKYIKYNWTLNEQEKK